MNILIYTSFSNRSNCIESTALYFSRNNNVFLLTTSQRGELHAALEKKGITCFSSNQSKHLKQIFFLRKFIQSNKIDVVHAHLQLPSFYSSILNIFYKFRLLTVRHNSDVIYLENNKKEIWIEKIINLTSPNIVAISDKVKDQLIEKESVDPQKIYRINNGYNFEDLNLLSNEEHFSTLKEKFKDKFVILMPGRFIVSKRHCIAIELIRKLRNRIDGIHLIFIGNGPEQESIINLIEKGNLSVEISVLEFTTYISDYYKIADVIIQPSLSEASNNVIKEALFFDKPVFACKDVGDFDTYLEKELLLPKNSPLLDLEKNVLNLYNYPKQFDSAIMISKSKMLELFSIEFVGKMYDQLNQKIE